MHFKALVSAIALGAAVSLSAPANAQEMINGVAIPEDEMALVQAHCDELAEDAENESLVTTTDDDDAGADDSGDAGDDSGDADSGDDEAGGEGEPGDENTVSATAEAVTTVVDLDQVDLQACVDAGLVEEPPM